MNGDYLLTSEIKCRKFSRNSPRLPAEMSATSTSSDVHQGVRLQTPKRPRSFRLSSMPRTAGREVGEIHAHFEDSSRNQLSSSCSARGCAREARSTTAYLDNCPIEECSCARRRIRSE